MCHTLLQDPQFFRLLVRIDEELAEETRLKGCACDGVLHVANYPRKPRGCLSEFRSWLETRFSFCCSRCRQRRTPRSVRFLGRRVYVALAMVLMSNRQSAAERQASSLQIPVRTLQRWARWWRDEFVQTPFWRANQGRFMPPVALDQCPASLLDRFAGEAAEMMQRLLVFLSPLSVRMITLPEGR